MYGWIHKCFKETIVTVCGKEKWDEICSKAAADDDLVSNCDNETYMDDADYFALVAAALEILPHITEQELYDIFGDFFLAYIRKDGYEAYLLTFGDTLFDLLNNMNRLHTHLACSMDKLKVPVINCLESSEQDCFVLHYSSPRGARLKGLLAGLVKSVARQYFSSTVELTELATQGDLDSPSTVWKVCVWVYVTSRLVLDHSNHTLLMLPFLENFTMPNINYTLPAVSTHQVKQITQLPAPIGSALPAATRAESVNRCATSSCKISPNIAIIMSSHRPSRVFLHFISCVLAFSAATFTTKRQRRVRL